MDDEPQQPSLTLEELMSSCPIFNDIVTSECDMKLSQDTYYEFQNKYMNAFFKSVLEAQGACFGGNIELFAQGRALSASEQKALERVYRKGQYIITESGPTEEYKSARIRAEKSKLRAECRSKQKVVVEVTLKQGRFTDRQWETLNDAQLEQVYTKNDQSLGCDEGWCGHYTVAVIDNRAKTIRYFESNGSFVPWLPPVVRALRAYFLTVDGGRFRDHTFVEPGEFCPRVSIQSISQTAMCAYWGTLTAVLDVACPQIDTTALLELLVAQGQPFLVSLLQNWHCYMWLYSVSSKRRIVDARRLADTASAVIARIAPGLRSQTDIRIFNRLVQTYNRALRLIDEEYDTRRAFDMLYPVWRDFLAIVRNKNARQRSALIERFLSAASVEQVDIDDANDVDMQRQQRQSSFALFVI